MSIISVERSLKTIMAEIITKKFKIFLDSVLDYIFPRTDTEKLIHELKVEDISERTKRAEIVAKENVNALLDYGDPLAKSLIWELKYRGSRDVAEKLGRMMHDEIIWSLSDLKLFYNFTSPLLVPVPLSKERERERGWNQCELLCDAILKAGGEIFAEPEYGALKKIRNTTPQSKLKKRENRLGNLKGCFRVSAPEKIRGRNILLIDDVTTTGATLREAEKTLLKSGARMVVCFTVAH